MTLKKVSTYFIYKYIFFNLKELLFHNVPPKKHKFLQIFNKHLTFFCLEFEFGDDIISNNPDIVTTVCQQKQSDDTAVIIEDEIAEEPEDESEKDQKLCRLYLWYFLLRLLDLDDTEHIISWTNKETLEFKIHDAKRLALMWGNLHGRENMTYAKFSRALRYHYKKGVIQKVNIVFFFFHFQCIY